MNLLSGTRVIIGDCPGHEQYTRNMAGAASLADVAVVLVDAKKGLRPQSFRHINICHLMGVSTLIVAINKMDLIDFSNEVYLKLLSELKTFLHDINFDKIEVIPVSALSGENLVALSDSMPWYAGPTLLQAIEGSSEKIAGNISASFSVQTVIRTQDFRGIAGTLRHGNLVTGDQVTVLPSNKNAIVSKIFHNSQIVTTLPTNGAGVIELEPEIDVTRGDLVVSTPEDFGVTQNIFANLIWMSDVPLKEGDNFILKSGAFESSATVSNIVNQIEITSGKDTISKIAELNSISKVEIALREPTPVTSYQKSRFFGNFILINSNTYETNAAGMVLEYSKLMPNVFKQRYEIGPIQRAKAKKQIPFVIWLTGLSGSGKSTIANELEKIFALKELHTFVLDGDNLRYGLNSDLGFEKIDRKENVRRTAEVAKLFTDAGLIVIVALVSPYQADRDSAKRLFEKGKFIEIWVNTPPELCEERDTKGLYAKAKTGEILNFTGISQEYEAPEAADLILNGADDLKNCVQNVLALLARLELIG